LGRQPAAARRLLAEPGVAAANPLLQPVKAPARVILWSGSEDKIVPPRYGERYASRWPNARHVVWPGAGHFDLVSPHAAPWLQLLDEFDALR
jgi:pimeloyl-ACP methyl ester carboxylesterase